MNWGNPGPLRLGSILGTVFLVPHKARVPQKGGEPFPGNPQECFFPEMGNLGP